MAEKNTKTAKNTAPVKKPEKKKKRHPLLPLWIVLGCVVLLLGAGFLIFNHYYGKLDTDKPEPLTPSTPGLEDEAWKQGLSEDELQSMDEALRQNLEAGVDGDFSGKHVKNILLIGVDNDYVGGMDKLGNADGLIIVSINEDTKRVVLNSIMRDSFVAVPDRYNTKITLTYHFGGVDLLLETLEANFGIPIDNYVLVNYLNLIDIVNAMGGVEMDVTAQELYWMQPKIENLNGLLGRDEETDVLPTSMAGRLTLNGIQTAAYLRIRYAGNGDFDRTGRARDVVLALKDKAAAMSVKQLNELADVVLPCVTTDLSQGEVLSLLLNAPKYMKYEMESNRIPIDGAYSLSDNTSAGSVVVIDYPMNKKFLYDSIYGE